MSNSHQCSCCGYLFFSSDLFVCLECIELCCVDCYDDELLECKKCIDAKKEGVH